MKPIRIATRKSQLALWQAENVRSQLKKIAPDREITLVKMSTEGDRILDSPLAKIGGKGLFIKELEQGLLDGRCDLAVHSTKDVPALLPDKLQLSAICQREDPRDAFVSIKHQKLSELPTGAYLGTSSLRRQCQIRANYPQIRIADLRGNVNTRLKKLEQDRFDAIILAAAGLIRLQLQQHITAFIDTHDCLPAVGQGAVCIESRRDNDEINIMLQNLHDPDTAVCVMAERAMNERLQGGCQVPIGGHAVIDNNELHLRGLVGKPDGSKIIRAEVTGPVSEHVALGMQLAEELLSQGAREILDSLESGD
ncbi:MAG: hydroxymethylbilane synthase [Gammaproteobacteria bacterium]|nr:MAG: hydroxymethylbilane synthase [Gammaproteobacteria bacterium]